MYIIYITFKLPQKNMVKLDIFFHQLLDFFMNYSNISPTKKT